MGIMCTFNFHVPIDGDCAQGKLVVPLVIPPYVALLVREPRLITMEFTNHTHYKMWDEITYPFVNFNGATVEV